MLGIFFAASFLLYLLFATLTFYSSVLYGIGPLIILSLTRFLVPLPTFFIVAINWFKFVIDPNPKYLSVTLLVMGIVTGSLGSLFVIYMPLSLTGQHPSAFLFFYIFPALGLILIFTGIYVWVKKERFVELLAI